MADRCECCARCEPEVVLSSEKFTDRRTCTSAVITICAECNIDEPRDADSGSIPVLCRFRDVLRDEKVFFPSHGFLPAPPLPTRVTVQGSRTR